jgi:hypothetical protein
VHDAVKLLLAVLLAVVVAALLIYPALWGGYPWD